MILTLTGAILLAILVYCLVMTLLLAFIHCRRAGKVSIRLSPQRVVCGGWVQVNYYENNEPPSGKKIFQFPGTLVRCRVLLCTKDKRRIICNFSPESVNSFSQVNFQAEKRGAYFSAYDEFACFDILGFFCFSFRVPADNSTRLLVSPHASVEPVTVDTKGGKFSRQDAPPAERADILIEHRPYVPGDDPRRINWKLYSHGGELFIRQGEQEPPPHSSVTILIDTQFDELYTLAAACNAVDLLCENALAIINNAGKEIDIQVGFTGQTQKEGGCFTQAELGFFLAYPAALTTVIKPAVSAEDLPSVHEERAILILALPRVMAVSTALDRFLINNAGRSADLIFIYGSDNGKQHIFKERSEAAETCVNLYNKRPSIRARAIGVQQ